MMPHTRFGASATFQCFRLIDGTPDERFRLPLASIRFVEVESEGRRLGTLYFEPAPYRLRLASLLTAWEGDWKIAGLMIGNSERFESKGPDGTLLVRGLVVELGQVVRLELEHGEPS